MPTMTSQRPEQASIGLSRVAYRIACRMDLSTPKPAKKEPKERVHYNVRHTDEQVLALIRRVRAGECMVFLAAKEGISLHSLTNWVYGKNRAHLLMQVEREEHKASARA